MSSQELTHQADSEFSIGHLPIVTVSNLENDVLDYSSLTTSPIVSIASWPEMTGQARLWLHCECTLADGSSGIIKLAESAKANNHPAEPAFSCELPLDELSKLADHSPITIILMASTDGSRKKQSLLCSRTSLIFHRPATLNNYSRWMTDIGSDIESLKIHDLIIPETHNSGIDQKGAGWPTDQWAACQDDTFTYQLNNGARALDLRMYWKRTSTYIFEHGGYDSKRYLSDCIHSVLLFVQQNPGEFVILDFHEVNLDDFNKRRAAEQIEETLGAHCIPREAADLTIAQIRNQWPGRNVIIAWGFSFELHWPKVNQTWTGRDQNNEPQLQEHIKYTFSEPPTGKLWSMFAAGYDWLGPIRFYPNSAIWKPFFDGIASDRYRVPSKGNMINVDFIAGSGVVEKCITATRLRAHQATLSRPRGLTTSNISTDSIHLKWLPPLDSDPLISYEIYLNDKLITSLSNSTEYIFRELKDGTTYRIQVIAYFNTGRGAAAGVITRTVAIPDITKPTPPTNLRLDAIEGVGAGILSWTAATDNIKVIGYQVYRGGLPVGGIVQHTSTAVYTVPGESYKVRAFDAAQNFADSASLVVPKDQNRPSRPTNLHITSLAGDTVSMEWAASNDNVGVTGYQVYRDNTPLEIVTIPFFIDRNVTDATAYTYSVSALDAANNESLRSDTLPVTTLDVTSPSKPANLHIENIHEWYVLSWSPSTDNVEVVSYEIYRNGTYLDKIKSPLFFLVDGTEPYWFKVRALDAAGNYSDSNLLASKDNQPPSKPGNLRGSFITDNTVTLDWNASTDNVAVIGYQVLHNFKPITTVDSTRYTVTGLEPGSYNVFHIRALDPAGNASNSDQLPVTTTKPDTTPPSKPTNLRATTVTHNGAVLQWDAASDNIGVVGYQVHKDHAPLITVPGTQHRVIGLEMGSTYIFKVRAMDAAGNGTDSNTLPVTTIKIDPTPPSTPTNLRATVTHTSATLEWNPSSDNVGVTGYKIFKDDSPLITVPGTSHTVNGLAEGATYHFRVRAMDAAGNGSDSDTLPVTTKPDATPPSKPTNLRATVTHTSATLEWNPSSDNVGVTGYKIFKDDSPLITVPGTSHTVNGLAEGATYHFKVRAMDAAGNGSDSDTLPVTTKPDTTPPSKPTNLRATSVTHTSATLEWNPSSDNVGVTGYQVFIGDTPLITVPGTSHTVNGMAEGATYHFKVRAMDAAGNGSDSDILPVTTTKPDTTAPSKPENLNARYSTPSTARLSWDAASDNVGVTHYEIFKDGVLSKTEVGTTAIITDLAGSTEYVFSVRALDAASNAGEFEHLTYHHLGSDGTLPSTPGNLRASAVTSNTAVLEWSRSTDNVAVTGYEIRRSEALIDTVTEPRYHDTNLNDSTTYTFEVRAVDGAGNRSLPTSVQVTTLAGNGPTNLQFERSSSTFGLLQWEPPVESGGVTGYRLSRDGQIVGELSQTYHMFLNLTPGVTHLFEVRAIRSGQYSDPAYITG